MQNQSEIKSGPKILELPDKCICKYHQQISAYRCSFQVKNIGKQTIYLNMVSTFLHFMELQQKIEQLKSGESKTFKAKVRPPNQIYPDYQFIGFTYSFINHADFYAIFNLSPQMMVKLEFQTDISEDIQIDTILKQQSQKTHQIAKAKFKQGNFKNAKQLCEEAFILYRKNISVLITAAQSELKLRQIVRTTKIVELLFYFPENPEYFKAVLIKAQTVLSIINNVQISHKLDVVKRIMKFLKKILQSNMADEQFQVKSNYIMGKYNQIKQQLLSTQRNGIFNNLLQSSIDKFDQNQNIKQHFSSKDQYISLLKILTVQQHKGIEQTPDYALDPINYEIFKDPVITPTGLSYQKKFIVNFFQKHGPQDPFTRAYLDPNLVFNNTTLKLAVRNSPKLQKWIKYEEQITRL